MKDEDFPEEEANRRRDEVLKRMLNTPPKLHVDRLPDRARSRKKAGDHPPVPEPEGSGSEA